jgi:putative ABC transport system permease protein
VNFIRLAKKANPDALKKKLSAFVSRYMTGLEIRPGRMYLLALKDLHVDSIHVRGAWRQDPRSVYLITLSIGIALLMVVCCNYMSLATAQYMARTGEVGVRKVLGGSRFQLVVQFLTESIFIALIAFALSIALGELMYPKFARLIFSNAGPKITGNPAMLLKLFLVTILVGIVAGSYPAFFLARLRPMEIFGRVSPTTKKGAHFRQILVIVQFGTSIFLMVIAVLAVKQFDHLTGLDLGYNKEGVYLARIGYGNYTPDVELIKNVLKEHPGTRAVSAASYIPIDWETESRVNPEGATENESWIWDVYAVDREFIELLAMDIIKGRSFLASQTGKKSFIINETAAHLLPWDDPIGKQLRVRGEKGEIIGVVKDFHFRHIFFKKMPSVLHVEADSLNYLYIKLKDPDALEPINHIKDRWDRFDPDLPFEYAALDEYFQHRYAFYKNLGVLISGIGIIAVIFSILGLIGLAAYATRSRTKEIGIRKAHGATVSDIILLFTAYFLRLILWANIIALPVTYYAAKKLVAFSLPTFPMEVDIEILIWVCFLTTIVAALSVILQTYRAAVANPVTALRYE